MDLTKYRAKLIGNEEERAVSPVIGVILMVAITVILAAVIAAFVLDMGDNIGNAAPSATFGGEQVEDGGVDPSSDHVVVHFTHDSGETIEKSRLAITTSGDGDASSSDLEINSNTPDRISAGEVIEVELQSSGINSGDTSLAETDEINLVWENEDSSSTLSTYSITSDIDGN
ncbi:type IV pilin [Natrialba taiwanensis]|uniref:type IV pilin n=1 Tax=Natrialba taiwanensis TaxID=160846 RepID=UPI0006779D2A|nr:type IV pilin N-terminal domain-containing protein [Natrialba taiwanensis]